MNTADRLIFLAEWTDSFSSINWKFHLLFYPLDGTLELYDLLKHRLFLKRTKCEEVNMEDLFIGATLRICSRLICIKDYADLYTRNKIESVYQKTCGFLNPEVINKGEILQSFIEQDLKIINLKTIQLTESVACELLKEYEDESLVSSIIENIISGPITVFQVLGENAVIKVSELVGPEDPEQAKTTNPDCLRARYGIDKIHNGIYISKTAESAERDARILFNNVDPFVLLKNTTCCVIKPHAVKERKIGNIIIMIERSGYEITAIKVCTLNTEEAEKFHEVYKYVVPEYQGMVQELCSGPCIALEIKPQSEHLSTSKFRELIGPLNVEIAKQIRPDTIRARFGNTSVQNAVHVTDLIEDSCKELEYLFRTVC